MNNKTALITGGASGLGSTISKYLASKGCNLVICYNTSYEKALELKKELENSCTITIIKCDFADPRRRRVIARQASLGKI